MSEDLTLLLIETKINFFLSLTQILKDFLDRLFLTSRLYKVSSVLVRYLLALLVLNLSFRNKTKFSEVSVIVLFK